MIRRREPCRNFQRGSCQYGDRCKFLHVTQHQAKSNPFGFGSQSSFQVSQTSQQPKPNPFGFGVKDATQTRGINNFGAQNQNPSKPFENKWIRPTAASNSTSSQQADAQKQLPSHECTDPESCKRQIIEDFKNEAPLWKLTCYGHWKYLPCDIVGDLSYEELRANAYEDAKRGLPLQSIVERERNLLNSKVAEFDNLLRNPYVIRSSGSTAVNQFSVSRSMLTVSPSNKPPTFASFSQLGTSASAAPIMSFGSPFSGTSSNTVFGQPSFPKNTSQISSGSQMKIGVSGIFGAQPQLQQFGSSPGPRNFGITNGFMAMESEQSPLHSISHQFCSNGDNQSSAFLYEAKVGLSAVKQALAADEKGIGADDSIWLNEWDIGEIPEEEPPPRVCLDINYSTRLG